MGFKQKLLVVVALAGFLTPQVATAHATPAPGPTAGRLLVEGLQGTVGGAIGPDRALYVPEAAIGQITRVDPKTGDTSVFASGLPVAVLPIGGAIDIAFIGRTAYVLVTLVSDDVGGDQIDGIYRIDDADSYTIIADLGTYSRTHPPATAFDVPTGVQFALEPVHGGFVVSDGHHNRVLRVKLDGTITELIGFDNIVPTGLAARHGKIYMGEAGPVPHLPETGKVTSFGLRHPQPRERASGFSLIVDVEFGHGRLYALSQGDSPGDVEPASPGLPDSGELLRVNRNGTFTPVVAGLDLPASVHFIGSTAFVVTLNGEVWRIKHVTGSHHHDDDDGKDH